MKNTIGLTVLKRFKDVTGDESFNNFVELYKPKSELVTVILGEQDNDLESLTRYNEYLEMLRNQEEDFRSRQQEQEVEPQTQNNFNMPTSSSNSVVQSILDYNTSEENKDYLIKLAKRESSYNPTVTNQYGYFGLYQFGNRALKDVGMSLGDLKSSISNQHRAALKLAELNEERLEGIIQKYNGKYKNGVKITKNGILAMAHLLGARSVKDYFNGTKNTPFAKNGFVDGNKTHILDYAKLFS